MGNTGLNTSTRQAAMNFLITLDTDNLEPVIRFYRAAFGISVGRRFGTCGVELLGGPAPLYLQAQTSGTRSMADPRRLDWIVDDIAAAVQQATAAGARLATPIETSPAGQQAFMLDPFGHDFRFLTFVELDDSASTDAPAARPGATTGQTPGLLHGKQTATHRCRDQKDSPRLGDPVGVAAMPEPLRILHLEDSADDAELIRAALSRQGLASDICVAASRDQFLQALNSTRFDLILSDSSVPGFSGQAALDVIQRQCPGVPFIFVSGHADETGSSDTQTPGNVCIPKTRLERLAPAIEQMLQAPQPEAHQQSPAHADNPAELLIDVIQQLSLARDLDSVMKLVRQAARKLTGADGATFVLREQQLCYYADEDAIAPLWKGSRFPMSACISGWVMQHKEPAVIEDIYQDPRIPADAYRPTFVKSLAMVPIRAESPIGAIGNYWAQPHRATPQQLNLLQALANSTAIALENLQLYNELEQRVTQRTRQLEAANQELEAFSYSVSHDLRAPLRHLDGFSQMLLEQSGDLLGSDGLDYLNRMRRASQRMGQLIDDLLRLSRISRTEMLRETVDLTAMARDIIEDLQAGAPERQVTVVIEEELSAHGDLRLLRVLLENLLSNAWKYSTRTPRARISVGSTGQAPDTYYIRDNGAGFDMAHADRLFSPFQRLHTETEFPGNGIGLATVQRIIHKHGGRIWPEAAPGEGATFFFTLA
jgi:signal transduction histidine kinase/predicted enzyme related to lactoylglutathione lyase/FixJ family two-component response regulator